MTQAISAFGESNKVRKRPRDFAKLARFVVTISKDPQPKHNSNQFAHKCQRDPARLWNGN